MEEARAGDTQDRRSGCRWLPILAVLLVVSAGLCGLGAFVLSWMPKPDITPDMEQAARQALLTSPEEAPIDLSSFDVPDYYPPNGSDYAVENDMVIFPQPVNRLVALLYSDSNIMTDREMTALVYAPDGLIPSPMRGHPCDHSEELCLHGLNEWYLCDCQQVDDHPLWWRCMLLDGNSMW